MIKYYLVKYNGNYADEFDVYFHTVMTDEELDSTKKIISETNWKEKDFYFGTNEWIEVSTNELLSALNNAVQITEEQFKVLQELDVEHIGFGDGLNWNWIIDCAIDEKDNDF